MWYAYSTYVIPPYPPYPDIRYGWWKRIHFFVSKNNSMGNSVFTFSSWFVGRIAGSKDVTATKIRASVLLVFMLQLRCRIKFEMHAFYAIGSKAYKTFVSLAAHQKWIFVRCSLCGVVAQCPCRVWGRLGGYSGAFIKSPHMHAQHRF